LLDAGAVPVASPGFGASLLNNDDVEPDGAVDCPNENAGAGAPPVAEAGVMPKLGAVEEVWKPPNNAGAGAPVDVAEGAVLAGVVEAPAARVVLPNGLPNADPVPAVAPPNIGVEVVDPPNAEVGAAPGACMAEPPNGGLAAPPPNGDGVCAVEPAPPAPALPKKFGIAVLDVPVPPAPAGGAAKLNADGGLAASPDNGWKEKLDGAAGAVGVDTGAAAGGTSVLPHLGSGRQVRQQEERRS